MATKMIKNQIAPEGFVFVNEGNLEAMAENISKISQAVQRMTGPGKLNRRGLITLIKEATRSSKVVDEREIIRVLDALSELENKFMTPKSKK